MKKLVCFLAVVSITLSIVSCAPEKINDNEQLLLIEKGEIQEPDER